MSALRRFHGDWGYVAIVFNAVAGIIALAAWRWPRLRGKWVWATTIAAEAAIMLQVLTGVILVSSHDYVASRFHMFYGFVAFITVGLAYSYRYQMRGRVELLYGLVGLFLMGVGIRALLKVG
ncbi:MAG: hypothetical protein JWL83_3245 [Actinomycetia bacterium]|nr:hypothetical protein [Actinomycetes bacterium]